MLFKLYFSLFQKILEEREPIVEEQKKFKKPRHNKDVKKPLKNTN